MTRQQFEEMTAELLEETIRITSRTLDEAEQRYPASATRSASCCWSAGPPDAGRRRAAQAGIQLGAAADRPRPGGRQGRGAVRRWARRSGSSRPDEGAEAAGQRRGRRPAPRAGLAAPGTGDRRGRAGGSQADGVDEEKVRDLAQRTVVNVLPKAVGVKLVDTSKPDVGGRPRGGLLHRAPHRRRRRSCPAGRDACRADHLPRPDRGRDRDLGAGRRGPRAATWRQTTGSTNAGQIEGLGPLRAARGSPINIDISVDAEGTVQLHAVEPTSGNDLEMNVRISVLSARAGGRGDRDPPRPDHQHAPSGHAVR